MKFRLVMTAMFGLLAAAAPGQQNDLFKTPAEPSALAALNDLFLTETSLAVQASFQQERTIAVLTRPLASSGSFYFIPEQGVCWQNLKPLAATYVINRDSMLMINSRGDTTKIPQKKIPQLASFTSTITDLFSGNPDGLTDRFDVFIDYQEGAPWRLGLVPREKELLQVITRITIDGSDAKVNRFLLEEPTGDQTLITFTDHQPITNGLPEAWHAALDQEP